MLCTSRDRALSSLMILLRLELGRERDGLFPFCPLLTWRLEGELTGEIQVWLEPNIVHQLHVMLGTLYKKSFEAGSMCGDVCAVEFVLMIFRRLNVKIVYSR